MGGPWLAAVVGVENSAGERVGPTGTPGILRLGTGFVATAVITSTGLARVEIEIDPDIVPGGVSEAQAPLEYSAGVLSILAASSGTRGTMSQGDKIKLDASTNEPAAQTLVQWGDDSELQAAWLEAVGNGDPADDGDVRLPEGGSIYGRNTGGGSNVRIVLLGEPNRLHIGAVSQALFLYSSAGICFGNEVDGSYDVHLMAGAAAAEKDVGLLGDGNLSVWVSSAARTVLTDLSGFAQGGNSFGAPAVLGSNDDDVALVTASGTNVYLEEGGAVGIGTSSPEYHLHVSDGSAAGRILSGLFRGTSSATGAGNSVDFEIGNAGGSNTRVRLLLGGNADAERWALETDTSGNGTHNFVIRDIATGTVYFEANATGLGFFGVTPVARPAAYTQTYSTASRTHAAYTADDESAVYSGIDNAQVGTVYAQLTDLNALRAAYEVLRAHHESTAKLLNSILDDLQAQGLLQ